MKNLATHAGLYFKAYTKGQIVMLQWTVFFNTIALSALFLLPLFFTITQLFQVVLCFLLEMLVLWNLTSSKMFDSPPTDEEPTENQQAYLFFNVSVFVAAYILIAIITFYAVKMYTNPFLGVLGSLLILTGVGLNFYYLVRKRKS